MKKIFSIIFVLVGFVELIVLSILSTFDNTTYSSYNNHFVGYMNAYGLWEFFYAAIFLIIIGIILPLIKKY